MSAESGYTLHHPKWYRRRVSVWWWLQKWSYTKFVLRELTSVAVAFFTLVSLSCLYALREGPEAYGEFLARLKSPLFLVLHFFAFFAVLYHALTWFHLAPRAMVLRLGGKRVSDFVIVGLNYLTWIVLSAAVAWTILRG